MPERRAVGRVRVSRCVRLAMEEERYFVRRVVEKASY